MVDAREAPPPVATTLFSLTPRGEALSRCSTSSALGRPLHGGGPGARGRLPRPLAGVAGGALPRRRRTRRGRRCRSSCGPARIRSWWRRVDGAVRARPAVAGESADAVLSGSPHAILGLLSGRSTSPRRGGGAARRGRGARPVASAPGGSAGGPLSGAGRPRRALQQLLAQSLNWQAHPRERWPSG